MACCGSGRPNRSDVHLSSEEEAKIEGDTRGYFDERAPKRHTKPQRSEYSSQYTDSINDSNTSPELLQLQRLESDPQKLVYSGKEVTEEFVETEYYKDLNCVDKQHHTTGTGFIKMENENGKFFNVGSVSTTCCHATCQGNPATNEWIPATADTASAVSDKPNRSDN